MTKDTHDRTAASHTGADETAPASEEAQYQAQHFIDLPSRWDRWEPLAEIIATVILAVATVATAWSGYQSARWGGEQSTKFSQAGALRTESTRASTKAGQLAQIDVSLFTNWIDAFAADNQDWPISMRTGSARSSQWPLMPGWLPTPKPIRMPQNPRFPWPSIQSALPKKQTGLNWKLRKHLRKVAQPTRPAMTMSSTPSSWPLFSFWRRFNRASARCACA